MGKTITVKQILILGAIFIGMILTACQQVEDDIPQASSDTLALGRQVYADKCASCHGADGEGQRPDNPLEPDETGRFPAPPHDETGHTWHHDDDLLIRIIKEGGMGNEMFYEMPAFGDLLADEEIEAVLAFIKTMWTDEQQRTQFERTQAVRQQD